MFELQGMYTAAATTATTTTTVSSLNIISPVRNKAFIRLVPHVGLSHKCFVFDIVDRELERDGSVLGLGRYSDRTVVSDRISFKSKVVSRFHAELWLSKYDGKIYIKDTGSSTGTYVNNVRLGSVARELVDGDIIQLGTDYKGGHQPSFRAVRIRLEVDRQPSNTFSMDMYQQLIKTTKVQECCICLYCISPFQALFVAPCSHVYHYRCLRPVLNQNYPGFSCPLCKAYSNLEEDQEGAIAV